MRKYAPYCAGTNPALSKRSPVTYWGEFRNGCPRERAVQAALAVTRVVTVVTSRARDVAYPIQSPSVPFFLTAALSLG